MLITILNGNDSSRDKGFDDYLRCLAKELDPVHQVDCIHLQTMDIKDCMGCFGCWQKTPGKCLHRDDMELLYIKYVRSELVLFASPIIMGFPSALLKRSHDRLIPLVHPYVDIANNDFHHVARYKRYPNMGLLLAKEVGTDQEDIQIITNIYKRIALSFNSTFVYSAVIDDKTPEVIAYEIGRC